MTTIRLPEPVPNDRSGWTLGETDTHYVDLCPMMFNHRLVLTPKTCTMVWDKGWCYPSLEAAVLAFAVWDPERQERPVGWIKEAHSDTSAEEFAAAQAAVQGAA